MRTCITLTAAFAISNAGQALATQPELLPETLNYQRAIAAIGQTAGDLINVLPGSQNAGAIHGTELRSAAAQVNTALLDRLQIGDRLRVHCFEDLEYEAVVQRFEDQGFDTWSWYGQIAGIALSDFMIVQAEDAVYAQFRDYVRDRYVEIRMSPDGGYVVREIQSDHGDFCQMVRSDSLPQAASTDTPPPTQITDRDAVITIDILGVYTPAAAEAEGGANAMKAYFQACVNDLNVRLSNSLTDTRARLVWIAEMTGYQDHPCLNLNRLINSGDGYMDEVHPMRDYFGADIVALIGSGPQYDVDENGNCTSDGICGSASLLTAGCQTQNCRSLGFAQLRRDCNLAGRTFAHEVGHLLGACHEVGDGGGGCENSLPHPHGKRWTCDLGACEQVFTDTMAYGAASCYDPITIPYFAHRDLSFNPGESDCTFCGPCPDTDIGDEDTHFAAGTIYFWGRSLVNAYDDDFARVFALSGYSGTPEGTALQPYNSLAQASVLVAPHGTVLLFAGEVNEGPRTFTHPMKLITFNGPATIR